MQLHDTLALDSVRRTTDGYLAADVRVARTGIQTYLGIEVDPKGERFAADQIVRVYRPEAEVFNKDALHSFAHRPVTLDHPNEAVTADNWRKYAVGQTGDEVARDGEFVRVPMVLMDAEAIKAVEDGRKELSMGYSTELRFEDGATPDGEAYDAVQTSMRMNHLAVVRRARGGSDLKIGDDHKGDRSMTDRNTSLVVDGVTVALPAQDAQIVQRHIAKLEQDAETAGKALADAKGEHGKAIEAKDTEIGELKAKLKDAEDKSVSDEDLDKLVADRAALVASVQALDSSIETKGVKDADLRRAAVASKYGDDFAKDASDAEIAGIFKAIAKDVKPADPLARALSDTKPSNDGNPQTVRDAAHADYIKRLNGADDQKETR